MAALPASLDPYYTARIDQDATPAALHVWTDPVDGVVHFTLYSDDGYGNGNEILSIPLAALLRAVAGANAPDHVEHPAPASAAVAGNVAGLRDCLDA